MEFKAAMRIWKRMCESNGQCGHCPMPGHGATSCPVWVMRNPDHAEAILAKWAEEHPERTIMDDFFAKHPKAPRRSEGYPSVCALQCGYIDRCPEHKFEPECPDCWRRPLEEVE